MITSNGNNQTLGGTSGDGITKLMTVPAGIYTSLVVRNTGTVAGYFTLDNGTNLVYLAGGDAVTVPNPPFQNGGTIAIERITSGSDMTGIEAIVQ